MNITSWDPIIGVILLANALVIVVITFGKSSQSQWRWPVSLACAVAILCYISWRVHYILLGFTDIRPIESFLSVTFLLFEIVNFTDFFLFLFTMSRFKDRSLEADRVQKVLEAAGHYPKVDVFVATYNEDWEILKKTIIAIQSLDYPNFKGYILDDGSRDWLKQKCEELNFGYMRRTGSAHKKPGNHNYALAHTSAPYIAVFDADFIPLPHFLRRTVPLMEKNTEWGILQTPQSFYNADPMRSNLKLQRTLPDDTAMFFSVMEPCRDTWGCAFYVGSSALLRRTAIDAINGIVMGYDTEDQITSVAMLQKGYQTGFLNEILSIGLAPETLNALFEQRKRWARGSIQILFSKHGPLGPNLTLLQRLMFCQSFWLIGFIAPIVYACIPPAIWLFQLRLFPYMPPEEVVILPLLLFSCISLSIWWLSRGMWYPFVSPALQLLLSFEILPTIVTSLIKPFGKPLLDFSHVTPKGKDAKVGTSVNWKTLKWLLAIIMTTFLGMGIYFLDDYKFINHPDEMAAAIIWTTINLIIVLIAVLGCINIGYKRVEERFWVNLPGSIGGISVETLDVSLSGALLKSVAPIPDEGLLTLDGIGEVRYTKKREQLESVAVEFLDICTIEVALFKVLFLNSANHQQPLGGPIHLYKDTLKRLFG